MGGSGTLGSGELTDDEIFVMIDKMHHRTGKVVQIKHLNLGDFKRIEC
jgi:hypothetical protein